MEFTKNNKTGYTQAIISMLIIFCTFMPFYKGGIDNGYYSYYKTTSAMLEFTTFLAADLKTHIGVFFVISIMLQLVNILVQPRRNNATLPIVAGLTGGISILMLHSQIDDAEKNGVKITYLWGFFLLLALMALQIIIQITATKEVKEEKLTYEKLFKEEKATTHEKNEESAEEAITETKTEASSPEPVIPNKVEEIDEQLKKEMQETDMLKEELRILKAKAEQVQKEKKLKENIEKERQEKEMLLKEIAKLKRQLEESENNA